MKRVFIYYCLIALLLSSAQIASSREDPEKLFVKVRLSKLRAEPMHWARGLATLRYGDELEGLEGENDGWLKVARAGTTGYVHGSALTEREVVLESSSAEVEVEPDKSDVIWLVRASTKKSKSSTRSKT